MRGVAQLQTGRVRGVAQLETGRGRGVAQPQTCKGSDASFFLTSFLLFFIFIILSYFFTVY